MELSEAIEIVDSYIDPFDEDAIEAFINIEQEIERKDDALQKISDHVDVRLELYKNDRETLYGLQAIARQALSEEG